jgi:hypothetical protein
VKRNTFVVLEQFQQKCVAVLRSELRVAAADWSGNFGFAAAAGGRHSSLDDLCGLIDWMPIAHRLAASSGAAKGDLAWPPLVLLKAMLLSVWYDLSDVKRVEALTSGGSA